MNFTTIDNNGRVEGFCLVKSVEQKTSSKGDCYLDMTLGDADGEINAKLWRYDPDIHGEYRINEIVKIRGLISKYNGSDQLKLERIRCSSDDDNVNIEDFVRNSGYSSEEMYNSLINTANEFCDEELKKIVTEIYADNRMALLYWPAAFKLHHALRGGLLMHTLSVVKLAESVSEIYPFIDRELLISGAMLHDIAKLSEFVVSDSGIADGYSVEGNLLGHLTMGAMVIQKYAEKLGISKETTVLLQHMIISHHGEPEFGAAVRPMFLEAEILAELDLMDSRIYEVKDALCSTENGGFSQRLWALDNRKFYNHSRKILDEKPKLL